jgi:hypothetical protein
MGELCPIFKEDLSMTNFAEIAAAHGGKTEKLKIGPKPYERRTIEEMCEDVILRINLTIADLEAFNELDGDEQFVSPMAKEVRHGFEVKIGYGGKNEKLDGIAPMNFWSVKDAIGYLVDIRQLFEAGEGNQVLEAKLQNYAKRAEKARAARHKQPLAIAA